MYNAVIVGSGPGGTSCAYGLRGMDTLVLDVGYTPPAPLCLSGNIYDLRRSHGDLFEHLIGDSFEGLHNLHKRKISLKLKSPHMAYVTKDWEQLSPVISDRFEAVISLAQGGLANAWGAGVYRFSDEDLRGFPISAGELEPFYDQLTTHIGICGQKDDLKRFFGSDANLLPPLRISEFYSDLLARYERRREYLNARGVFIGYPRLAVLTQPHRNRSAYLYDNLEFFKPHNPAIYNPAFTLMELVDAGEVAYKAGYLVTHYSEESSHVNIFAKKIKTGEVEMFQGRKLFLAAGALNSARIVLQANKDINAHLPILDNAMVCVPFFQLGRLGARLETYDSSLAQLNLISEDPQSGERLQATLYGTTGPLRSDVLFQVPLAISAALKWAKYVSPAMGLAMLFYPDKPDSRNFIRLRPGGELEVSYTAERAGTAEVCLSRAFRKMGYICSAFLAQRPRIGSGLHYAGTLPMKGKPGPYETDSDGRLFETRHVHVVDGGCFSELPSKNLTFTIMANALRIATKARHIL